MHRLLPSRFLQPRWCRIYGLPVSNAPACQDDTITFRWASAADTPMLESQLGEKVTTARHSCGHRAAILLQDSRLIGVAWFATRSFYDADTATRITLSFDEAWIYGVWIHHKHQSAGLYERLLQHAGVELRRRGIRLLLLTIDATDIRSRRLHRRLSAKPVGYLFGIRIAFYHAYRFHREPLTAHS